MLYNPLIQPISPEGFVRKLGLDELLIYSESMEDTPNFNSSTLKHLVRASEYNLIPKWNANVDTPMINGLPDHTLFSTDMVTIEGSIQVQLAATMYNTLEYPMARFFEHLRNAFSGLRDTGSIVSPRDDLISDNPWFSLASAYHGTFVRCLVNKLSFNAKMATDPIALDWGIVASNYTPQNAFSYQNLRSLTNAPAFKRNRRVICARDLTIETAQDTVVGHFGMPDAANSVFASGPNKPSNPDYVTAFDFEIDNRLEVQHTAHSHELTDLRARYAENVFPHAYASSGQRSVSGSITWWGNSAPLSFTQKITGPGSVQNKQSLIINAQCFKIEILDPVWSLSETPVNLNEMVRTARFSAASDGVLIIPQYSTDY